ncbi:MAG: Rha family transcriptional regulator, partial [Lactobacillus sp.]|nr:Rha family transcriptional regulator [Lactobacillus sp.]
MENQVEIIKQVGDQKVMDSRDVAKMIGKTHAHLMRDISRYINDMEMD